MKKIYLIVTLLVFWAPQALLAQKKIVLTTYNSQITDAIIGSITPDINWGNEPHIWPYTWTQNGVINITRPLIRFDLSEIPSDAAVLEALLILHYDPYSGLFGYHEGLTDFTIRRITEPWEELTVTWNNQPSTTTEHEIQVPPAGFNQQNYVVDVTQLVRDMLKSDSPGNYGFMFSLDNEFPYNAVRLAGAENPDPSRHPQLWITLDDEPSGAGSPSVEVNHYSVGPNPTSGQLFVSSKTVPEGENTAEVYDAQGKLVLSQALTGSYSLLYLQDLPAGMYLMKIFNDTDGYIQEEKIVVAK